MPTRYDPFRELDRLFTDALRAPASAAMPMDLYRSGETFTAVFDLPGVDPDSIDIDVEDRTLTVRAERHQKAPGEVQWLTRERTTGAVARQLTLGPGLALDKIEAGYADGVLTLTFPVAEEAKPRKIAVQHTGATSAPQVEMHSQTAGTSA
jgi:HSP20 family protein